jgi:hypothetical protein
MKNLLLALALALTTSFTYADAAKDAKKDDRPPVQAQKKPDVKKPCKEGQYPKKGNCHELKKIEKKK